jgi:hypothetical protein
MMLKSRYNNGLIAKLMLMWREGIRKMRAWLPCKHKAGTEAYALVAQSSKCCEEE